MGKNSKQPKALYVIAGIIMLYAVILLIRMCVAAGQTIDYPNEYREAANVAMTRSILEGTNIYSYPANQGEVPAVCYLYGPLMSLIAAGLSVVLPFLSLWTVHYLISFAAIVISALLIAFMVKRNTKTIIAFSAAFVLTLFCHWRYGYIYGAPDSLGLCLMIAVLYFLSCCDKKYEKIRRLYRYYPVFAAIFTVLTFFTKQYFLMVAATGGIYLLFISKKAFVKYAAAGVIMSVVTFLLLWKLCPLYFTYAVYFLKGPGAGAAMGKTGIAHNNLQISYLGGMLLALFAAALLALIKFVWDTLRHMKFSVNIKAFDAPLFNFAVKNEAGNEGAARFNFLILFWIQAALSAIVLRYIGNNNGAFLSYYLQLFTPALVVLSICCIDNADYSAGVFKLPAALLSRINKKSPQKSKKLVPVIILAAVYIVVFSYTIMKVEPRLIINMLSSEEMENWSKAYEILDTCVANGDIYYVPPLAYHGYENGQYIYNEGQPFVFSQKFLEYHEKAGLEKKLFPDAYDIIKQHLEFREKLRQRVLDGEYALVTTLDDMDVVFSEEDLSKHYIKKETIPLRTGNWAWDVQFWVKR